MKTVKKGQKTLRGEEQEKGGNNKVRGKVAAPWQSRYTSGRTSAHEGWNTRRKGKKGVTERNH